MRHSIVAQIYLIEFNNQIHIHFKRHILRRRQRIDLPRQLSRIPLQPARNIMTRALLHIIPEQFLDAFLERDRLARLDDEAGEYPSSRRSPARARVTTICRVAQTVRPTPSRRSDIVQPHAPATASCVLAVLPLDFLAMSMYRRNCFLLHHGSGSAVSAFSVRRTPYSVLRPAAIAVHAGQFQLFTGVFGDVGDRHTDATRQLQLRPEIAAHETVSSSELARPGFDGAYTRFPRINMVLRHVGRVPATRRIRRSEFRREGGESYRKRGEDQIGNDEVGTMNDER